MEVNNEHGNKNWYTLPGLFQSPNHNSEDTEFITVLQTVPPLATLLIMIIAVHDDVLEHISCART